MKVMLIFDKSYGERDDPELGDAFWLIESHPNRAIAERAWKESVTDPNSAVFRAELPATGEAVVNKVIEIDLHHPDWSGIMVVGVVPTHDLTSRLAAEGFSTEPSTAGMSVHRKVRQTPQPTS